MNNKIDQIGLPEAIDIERYVLGAILANDGNATAIMDLHTSDFHLEKHRRIFEIAREIYETGNHPDRVCVAKALAERHHEQDAFWYVASLDEGMPVICNIEPLIETLREKADLRRMVHLSRTMLDQAVDGRVKASEIISAARMVLDSSEDRRESAKMMSLQEVIEAAGGLDAFVSTSRAVQGILSPWAGLNRKTSGFRPGEVFVLAANSSMGKTSAAMQIAVTAARSGHDVQVFSLEMSRDSLTDRILCCEARVDLQAFRTGRIAVEERRRIAIVAGEMTGWPLRIAEHGASTVMEVRAAIRKDRTLGRQVELVVIDYLQLMRSSGRHPNRHSELSEISRQIKLVAIEENVSIVLLSQLNRDNVKHPPRPPEMSDLRDSGAIEENADAIGFIWRPEVVVRDREELRGMAELILAKQRNGPIGKVELVFLGSYTRFESRAEELDE